MDIDDLFPDIPDVPRETRSIWNPSVPRGTSKSDDPYYDQWGDSMDDGNQNKSNEQVVKQLLEDSGGADAVYDFSFLTD